jgi:hypothetical protein
MNSFHLVGTSPSSTGEDVIRGQEALLAIDGQIGGLQAPVLNPVDASISAHELLTY